MRPFPPTLIAAVVCTALLADGMQAFQGRSERRESRSSQSTQHQSRRTGSQSGSTGHQSRSATPPAQSRATQSRSTPTRSTQSHSTQSHSTPTRSTQSRATQERSSASTRTPVQSRATESRATQSRSQQSRSEQSRSHSVAPPTRTPPPSTRGTGSSSTQERRQTVTPPSGRTHNTTPPSSRSHTTAPPSNTQRTTTPTRNSHTPVESRTSRTSRSSGSMTDPGHTRPLTGNSRAPSLEELRARLHTTPIEPRSSGATPKSVRERYGFTSPPVTGEKQHESPRNEGSVIHNEKRPEIRNEHRNETRNEGRTGNRNIQPHNILPHNSKEPEPHSSVHAPVLEDHRSLRRLPREPGDLVVPNPGKVKDAWFKPAPYNQLVTVNARYRTNSYFDYYRYYPSWCVDFGFYSGFYFGYVFCRGCAGGCNHIYWYYRYPGFPAAYYPYNCYYRPSSYYLPSYYPVYSQVRYVTEYVDDSEYYPAIPTSTVIDPSLKSDELVALGWELFYNRDYPGAAESFRQAVLADPESAYARFAFSQGLFAIGNYPDAAFVLRRGMELMPEWPGMAANPRDRYQDPADHDEQMLALRTFMEYLPEDPAGLLLQAVHWYLVGNPSGARPLFEQLLTMDPEDQVALSFLAAIDALVLGPPVDSVSVEVGPRMTEPRER